MKINYKKYRKCNCGCYCFIKIKIYRKTILRCLNCFKRYNSKKGKK